MLRLARLVLFVFLGIFLSALGFAYNTFEFWVILITVILIQIITLVEKLHNEMYK
jgi:uncharacterized membrane protein YgaE (UPF0421/DUF939 family)